MKPMRKTIFSALSLLLLAACNSVEDNVITEQEGQDFDVTACRIANSRVSYTPEGDDVTLAWEQTDAISLYAYEGAEVNKGNLVFDKFTSDDKTQANFRGHFEREVTTTTQVYAFVHYPNVYNRRNAIVNDLHYQTGKLTGEGGAAAHDVLYATASFDPQATENLQLAFAGKMALVKIEATLPDGVSASAIKSCMLGGSGIYNYVTIDPQNATLQSGETGMITIEPAGLQVDGQQVSCYVALYPKEVPSASLTLTLSDNTIYEANLGVLNLKTGVQRCVAASVTKLEYNLTGTFVDETGKPIPNVVVTDGSSVQKTDENGRYAFNRGGGAQFVYFTLPSEYEVPTHSATDNSACCYKVLEEGVYRYDFTLKKLAGGKETNHVMIVLGDPQATTAQIPTYFEDATDNYILKYDTDRFKDETMADVRQTIASLPAGTPVYGLSMGDNVQYYGGYNADWENKMRALMGSTDMKVFSVIGNHDQDNSAVYKQRWHDAWGPSDYSFNRGNVHYVCLNDVQYKSTSGGTYYNPGEPTSAQIAWLKRDLYVTDKSMKVVLCYHVPLTLGTGPLSGATSMGNGHYASTQLATIIEQLKKFSGGYELWCGHTHFAVNNEVTVNGEQIYERSHAASCGDIWNSNINIDGVPNGYYVYEIEGTSIKNCYYKGTRWDKNKQMAVFKADTDFNGESYVADWNLTPNKGVIMVNLFNGDSRWKVEAIENGVRTTMTRHQATPNQDAFAVGYHHKYCKSNSYSFFSKQNKYLKMLHFYSYVPTDPNAEITIEATDPYGTKYTASSKDVVTEPFFNYAHYYAK